MSYVQDGSFWGPWAADFHSTFMKIFRGKCSTDKEMGWHILSSPVECGKQRGREAGALSAECLDRAGAVSEGLTHLRREHI